MPQGTLDMLVLQTLVLGPARGHTIAHVIERQSENVLQVEHGSLYPALHRLEDRGWIASFWGTSENNRKVPLLPADTGGTKAVDRARQALGAARQGDRPDHETGHGVNHELEAVLSPCEMGRRAGSGA
jgi:DNA-binding PadR family transcriptional regulator